MRSIYFHEDDYCQIEILPVQNYEYCKREIYAYVMDDDYSKANVLRHEEE